MAIGSGNGKDGPAETSLCMLPGSPAGPSYRGSPKGEVEEGQDVGWCPGNRQNVRGMCKSFTNTNPAKGEGCGFFIERNEIYFFSITTNPTTITSQGAIQQTHPSFHPICFPFVNLKVMLSVTGVSGA